MFQNYQLAHRSHPTARILSAVLLIALAAALLPLPAQAAASTTTVSGNCSLYYTVARGDTLYGIAYYFGISVRDLKIANGGESFRLETGAKICIPAISFEKRYPKASLTTYLQSEWIFLSAAQFPVSHSYLVKVRRDSRDTWVKLGNLKVGADGKFQKYFPLPAGLRKAGSVEMCLKEVVRGYTVCKTVPRMY